MPVSDNIDANQFSENLFDLPALWRAPISRNVLFLRMDDNVLLVQVDQAAGRGNLVANPKGCRDKKHVARDLPEML
jgi:hypothetical protein